MEKEQQRLDMEAKKVHREHGKERDKRQVCNCYSRFSVDGIQFWSFYGFLCLGILIFLKLHIYVPVFSFDPYASKYSIYVILLM